MRLPLRAAAALLVIAPLAACGEDEAGEPTVTATPQETTTEPEPTDTTDEPSSASPSTKAPSGDVAVQVVKDLVTGLPVPWGIAFLPDGTAVITERDSGVIHLLDQDGTLFEAGSVDGTQAGGEGGLLGVAVSPTYDEDRELFLYVTTSTDNRIVRTTLGDDSKLGEQTVILDGIPQGFIHDGGRMAFGPDGYLYASTGESGEPPLAQDLDSLGGKILRITRTGEPAPGNPFDGSPVWSYGHRNVQGLAFDDEGRLWASEFGDSSWDELNLIEKGGNYGWPEVEGRGGNGDYVDPKVVWSTDQASPSGLAWRDGSLWLAALRGERLWRIPTDGAKVGEPQDYFVGDYGRMRTVVVSTEGDLWLTTSNRDGRGDVRDGDDRIMLLSVR